MDVSSQRWRTVPSQDHVQLDRVDSISTIASDATAPNLPGPGRTVGLLYDRLGSRLETFLNTPIAPSPVKTDSQLNRVDSNESIASDATAPNLPGAGRTVGLFLYWLGGCLEVVMNKQAGRAGLGPEAIAQKIRLILGHQKSTLRQRHLRAVGLAGSVEEKKTKKLKKLCKRLLKYVRSNVPATQFQACEEIIALTVQDPLVREVLSSCDLRLLDPKFKEPDLILSTSRALGSIEFAHVHNIWSQVICRVVRATSDDDPLRSVPSSISKALRNSFRNPELSFLSARCFTSMLAAAAKLSFPSGPQIVNVDEVQEVWSEYMSSAAANPHIVEWANVNDCMRYMDAMNSFPFAASPSPISTGVLAVAGSLVRKAIQVPQGLSFALPVPDIMISQIGEGDKTLSPAIDKHNSEKFDSFETSTPFYFQFLKEMTGSDDINVHLSFIHGLDYTTRTPLKGTILGNDAYIAYVHLIRIMGRKDIKARYYGALPKRIRTKLLNICAVFARYLVSENKFDRDVALAILRRFAGMDRYCNLILHNGMLANGSDFSPIIFSPPKPHVSPEVRKLVSPAESSHVIFEGVINLRRFRVRDKYYITWGYLHYDVLRFLKDCGTSIHRDVSVHAMVINKSADSMVIPLFYPDGYAKPFNATGHYPVLANRDADGTEHFIAWVKADNKEWHFALVTDGARFATYSNQLGEERTTSQFHVLALKQDPSDLRPPYPHAVRDSTDETGSLGWVQSWPNKAEGYDDLMSPSGHQSGTWLGPDDDELEDFLSDFADAVDEMDGNDALEDKLFDTLRENGILKYREQKSILEALSTR